jgi:hypothetical protein
MNRAVGELFLAVRFEVPCAPRLQGLGASEYRLPLSAYGITR